MSGCRKGSEDHYWCWKSWHSDTVIMIIIIVVMIVMMMIILMMIMTMVKSCHIVHLIAQGLQWKSSG